MLRMIYMYYNMCDMYTKAFSFFNGMECNALFLPEIGQTPGQEAVVR